MKKVIVIVIVIVGSFASLLAQYPISQVPFTSVKMTPNTFWGQRLEASRDVTIPLAFSKSEETGRYKNFQQAAEELRNPGNNFEIKMEFPFDDTDPYKTLEGASYLMQTYPNALINGKPIDRYCDSVISIIAAAQEPDGYLYTARTQNPEHPQSWVHGKRWGNVEEGSHELYNLGHLCEAAVAHYNATGKTTLLNIAKRYADCVCRELGKGDGQLNKVPGHQIAEMGLAKLYLATKEQRYLNEAKYFLDERGRTNYRNAYNQTHKPVLEQDEAVGHAVRAGYMYAGMADIAALTGDRNYITAIDRIWDNIVTKKYYITGGVGATSNGEAFGKNYELPNLTAYNETCAAIANVYFNYRLFLLHGESKYFDVLERTLYNGVLSGISIDGGKFFYPNPLQSKGGYHREPWFGCACCPSNVARFIPSLPQYIYAVKDNNLYVNLFAGNEVTTEVNGKTVTLEQQTNYPWNGDVAINIKRTSGKYNLCIRIPGWVRGEVVPSDLYRYDDNKKLQFFISVNGQRSTVNSMIDENGYVKIYRKWKKGDKVEIHFDMEPRLVRANENVEEDKGKLCVERGPLVYCAEAEDNPGIDILSAKLSAHPEFSLGKKMICGTEVVTISVKNEKQTLNLIPYYAWNHRNDGAMNVWF